MITTCTYSIWRTFSSRYTWETGDLNYAVRCWRKGILSLPWCVLTEYQFSITISTAEDAVNKNLSVGKLSTGNLALGMQRVVTKNSLKNIKLLKVSRWALKRHLLHPQLIVMEKKNKIQQMGTGKKGKKTLIGLVGLIFSDGK